MAPTVVWPAPTTAAARAQAYFAASPCFTENTNVKCRRLKERVTIMRSILHASVLAAAIVCVAGSETHAVTVTLSDFSWDSSHLCGGQFGCSSNQVFNGGNATLAVPTGNGVATATGQGLVSPTTSPSLFASASVSVTNPNVRGPFAQAGLNFTYSMELITPQSGAQTIPVVVNSNASITGNPRSAGASLSITYDNGNATLLSLQAGNGLPGSFSVSDTENLTAGQIYSIAMNASISAQQNTNLTGTVSLDPFFQLSPAEINEGYRLIFSNGVGNGFASATPLPPALPLLVAGLGVVGLLARRKKPKAVALASA
jgi:hypothetical protein